MVGSELASRIKLIPKLQYVSHPHDYEFIASKCFPGVENTSPLIMFMGTVYFILEKCTPRSPSLCLVHRTKAATRTIQYMSTPCWPRTRFDIIQSMISHRYYLDSMLAIG